MTAAHAEYHDWESAAAYKLLCEQRELTFLQSKRTRGGVVAPFPTCLAVIPIQYDPTPITEESKE